jgi:integrase
VFPGRTGGPLVKSALYTAMGRAGIARGVCTPHGWRATASTIMGEWGVDRDLVELQLAHLRPGVHGLYDRSQRLDERAEMMQRWSAWLEGVGS